MEQTINIKKVISIVNGWKKESGKLHDAGGDEYNLFLGSVLRAVEHCLELFIFYRIQLLHEDVNYACVCVMEQ